MLQVNVQGGTGAGRVSMLPRVTKDWTCPDCGARNKYYWLKCPNKGCGHRRPEQEG